MLQQTIIDDGQLQAYGRGFANVSVSSKEIFTSGEIYKHSCRPAERGPNPTVSQVKHAAKDGVDGPAFAVRC